MTREQKQIVTVITNDKALNTNDKKVTNYSYLSFPLVKVLFPEFFIKVTHPHSTQIHGCNFSEKSITLYQVKFPFFYFVKSMVFPTTSGFHCLYF